MTSNNEEGLQFNAHTYGIIATVVALSGIAPACSHKQYTIYEVSTSTFYGMHNKQVSTNLAAADMPAAADDAVAEAARNIAGFEDLL